MTHRVIWPTNTGQTVFSSIKFVKSSNPFSTIEENNTVKVLTFSKCFICT